MMCTRSATGRWPDREELGNLLCQDTVHADEHKNQGKKQLKPVQVTVPADKNVGQVRGQARLVGISSTGRSENHDGCRRVWVGPQH